MARFVALPVPQPAPRIPVPGGGVNIRQGNDLQELLLLLQLVLSNRDRTQEERLTNRSFDIQESMLGQRKEEFRLGQELTREQLLATQDIARDRLGLERQGLDIQRGLAKTQRDIAAAELENLTRTRINQRFGSQLSRRGAVLKEGLERNLRQLERTVETARNSELDFIRNLNSALGKFNSVGGKTEKKEALRMLEGIVTNVSGITKRFEEGSIDEAAFRGKMQAYLSFIEGNEQLLSAAQDRDIRDKLASIDEAVGGAVTLGDPALIQGMFNQYSQEAASAIDVGITQAEEDLVNVGIRLEEAGLFGSPQGSRKLQETLSSAFEGVSTPPFEGRRNLNVLVDEFAQGPRRRSLYEVAAHSASRLGETIETGLIGRPGVRAIEPPQSGVNETIDVMPVPGSIPSFYQPAPFARTAAPVNVAPQDTTLLEYLARFEENLPR